MNREFLLYAGLLLFGVFLGAVSQVMLKKAALKEYSSKIKEYLNPLVILAYVIFVGTTLISVYAYRVVPLSLGSILEATSYIYVTIFGVVFFRETINIRKLSGLLLIIAGITIYALLG
ncbi:MAG: EamA family transporter [Lachnospiraceae bacterium]|nr:EamA family transporter [Lachnospiraceae bacterium]